MRMSGVLGAILPLAIGIAISPIPIIAAILMLLAPKAKGTSVGFMLGWIVGILVSVTVFTLLSAVVPSDDGSGSSPIRGIIQVALGAALVVLAIRQWLSRPKPGEEATLPKWMAAIASMTAGKAFLLGFLLAAVNPKNLLLGASAGVTIGTSGLDVGSIAVVIVIFTLIAAASVTIPVVAYLIASKRMAGPLESLRTWLVHNNATIMAVLLLVIGVVVIGKGIGSF
jgi:threonine/homoserine/homoserine lactone efflux protein